MKYRKKPVVVEATKIEWIGDYPQWLQDAVDSGTVRFFRPQGASIRDASVQINTPEGVMQANQGDWIIKGVNGEIYPCKSDVFEKTYELFEE